MNVETDIITSIAVRLIGGIVILVMMYVENLKTCYCFCREHHHVLGKKRTISQTF